MRSRSAIAPCGVPAGTIGPVYVTSGSRSLRGAGGTGIPSVPNTVPSRGSRTKPANCASLRGSSMLNRSFDPVPMMSSLTSGLPMRCTWLHRPRSCAVRGARRTVIWRREVEPYVPRSAARSVEAVAPAVLRQERDGNLDCDCVDVVTGDVVGRRAGGVVLVLGCCEYAAARLSPEVERIEGSAQVDVEVVVGGAGEHPNAGAEVVDALFEQAVRIGVGGHGARSGIRRHRVERTAACQVGALATLHQRDRVGLPQAESLGPAPAQLRDRWNARDAAHRGREDAGIADLGLEAHLELHVLGDAVLVVVHVERVEDAGIEGKVVRPVRRLEQWIDAQDHRHLAGVVVADERVPVGDVGAPVERGDRRLAMARCRGSHRNCQGQGRERGGIAHPLRLLHTGSPPMRPRKYGRLSWNTSRDHSSDWIRRSEGGA